MIDIGEHYNASKVKCEGLNKLETQIYLIKTSYFSLKSHVAA